MPAHSPHALLPRDHMRPFAFVRAFAFAALATCLATYQIAAQQPRAGAIRGQLVIARAVNLDTSPRELYGIPVSLDSAAGHTTTDSSGAFVFPDVSPGLHTITVAVPNRAPLTRAVSVLAGDTAVVVIDLSKSAPHATQLAPVVVSAGRALHVIGHLSSVSDNVIYSGKKTEVMVMDSLHANLAQDIERQILGRIPGAHFSETAGAGFPSNGVGFRGLDPTQSVEMNTRQNGVGIAADLFGYPE